MKGKLVAVVTALQLQPGGPLHDPGGSFSSSPELLRRVSGPCQFPDALYFRYTVTSK